MEEEAGMTRMVIPSQIWGVALVLMCLGSTARAEEPTETTYAHRSINRYEFGAGPKSYCLYEPASPAPEKAPVIVFYHGWLAINPAVYGAWIEHLVLQGNVVIFPRYQTDWTTRPATFLGHAQWAILDALHVLKSSPTHVKPDIDKFALIGHSAGANLSALTAASAAEVGMPIPKAVIAVTPGEVQSVPGPKLSEIHEDTLLIVVVTDSDVVVGDGRARQIFSETTAIPNARKKFIFIRSDRHGLPWLIADHFAPTAGSHKFDNGEGPLKTVQMKTADTNALDRAGFWRMTDITLEAAFKGKTLDEATNNGASFRTLGFWSDGKQVLPPVVSDDLKDIPRILPPHGIRMVPWTSPELIFEKAGITEATKDTIKK